MTNFDWSADETTDDPAASNDDAGESGLSDPESAGTDQTLPDDMASYLDNLLADAPLDQRDALREYAQKTARRLEGKMGPRIQNAERQAENYRQQYEQLLRNQAASTQTTPQTQQNQQQPTQDDNASQVKQELERLYPGLKDLGTVEQIKQAAGQIIMSQYDLQLERYLDAGPGKAYGELFDSDRREYLKDIIRANGFNVNAPNVMKAQERVKNEMQREIAAKKAAARNRAQIGEENSFSPSNAKPDIAKITPSGNFDWKATYQEAARRNRR